MAEESPLETVGQVAELYLGNILYAIELAAMTLDDQGKPVDASFYRGIARKLADAHGQAKRLARIQRDEAEGRHGA